MKALKKTKNKQGKIQIMIIFTFNWQDGQSFWGIILWKFYKIKYVQVVEEYKYI